MRPGLDQERRVSGREIGTGDWKFSREEPGDAEVGVFAEMGRSSESPRDLCPLTGKLRSSYVEREFESTYKVPTGAPTLFCHHEKGIKKGF